MDKIKYAYLHCHTKYSVQDALPSPKDYVDGIYNYNQNSTQFECIGWACTDHGSTGGLLACSRASLNPDDKKRITKQLYGCEVYMCPDLNNNEAKNRYHLILIAKNQIGLKNLYKITSHGGINATKGRSGKMFPITDYNYIQRHGEGIIALSACVAGIIPQCIITGRIDEAKEWIEKFRNAFDDFYLEVQPFIFPEQLMVNAKLVELSKTMDIKLVMTCDSHYILQSDRQYHNILKQISHQKEFESDNHLFTAEDMLAYCKHHDIPEECISNTALVAEQCEVNPFPEDNRSLLPIYPCPEGYDEESFLRKMSFDKLSEKILIKKIPNPIKYYRTLDYELDIICTAGYSGYFLILWDWFKWCRENNILMGPGRGSAAGSIVSYVLDITKVDPIKNGFFFERFLNPGRLSFPDIDSDVPRHKRAEAIHYLQTKYGKKNVSQIITYGEYKLKNTIKAVLSNCGCPFQESNELTKAIPDMVDGRTVDYNLIVDVHDNPDDEKYVTMTQQEKNKLNKVYDMLQETFKKYPTTYHAVKNVCGTFSSTGIHAGGVVVCREPINEHATLINGGDTAVLPLVQYDMGELEDIGLLKIDALGLKTLDVIKLTMELTGLDYDWYDSEDYTDSDVYAMLRDGNTADVFQFANYSPTKMISDFNSTCIEDLCAVNAGNRPGPLEPDLNTGKSMVDQYSERVKTGNIESMHSDIDATLAETKGLIWYFSLYFGLIYSIIFLDTIYNIQRKVKNG